MADNKPLGSQAMYLFNLTWFTVLLNVILFPGLCWLFYRNTPVIGGEVVASEIFFGGLLCTLIIGVTGHLETAKKNRGCFACQHRGNCPFLGILFLAIGFGVICVTASHFYLGNASVAFKKLLVIKAIQGAFLGVAIPQALIRFRLLLHPEVKHNVPCNLPE